MKKYIALLLVAVILLSGGNICYSMHFCGGKLAASKWTVGKEVSCGMTSRVKKQSCPRDFKSDCCKNQNYKYEVDENYSPSATLKHDSPPDFIRIEFPSIPLLFFSSPSTLRPHGKPPLIDLERLCVFRI